MLGSGLAEHLTPALSLSSTFSYLTFRRHPVDHHRSGGWRPGWGPHHPSPATAEVRPGDPQRRSRIPPARRVPRPWGPDDHCRHPHSVLLWLPSRQPHVWLVLFVLGLRAPSVLPMTISGGAQEHRRPDRPLKYFWQSAVALLVFFTPRPPTMARPNWWSPSSRM